MPSGTSFVTGGGFLTASEVPGGLSKSRSTRLSERVARTIRSLRGDRRPPTTLSAVIRKVFFAALAVSAALVAALPVAAAPARYVRIVSVTPVVAKGDLATLVAKVTPANAKCDLVIYLRSGPSEASGLGPRRAVNGRVSWTWIVSRHTTGGTWPLYVECGSTGIAKTWFRIV